MISYESLFFALVSNSGAKVILSAKRKQKAILFCFLCKKNEKTWDTLCRNGLNDFRQSEDSRQCFLFWAEVLEFSVQAGLIFRIQFQ